MNPKKIIRSTWVMLGIVFIAGVGTVFSQWYRSGTGPYKIYPGTSTSVYLRDSVGIGNSAPDAKLHVTSGTQYQLILQRIGSTTGKWALGAGFATNVFYIHDVAQAQTRMVIDANGQVGIGTTSPGGKLHVNGGNFVCTNNGADPTYCLGDAYTAGNYG